MNILTGPNSDGEVLLTPPNQPTNNPGFAPPSDESSDTTGENSGGGVKEGEKEMKEPTQYEKESKEPTESTESTNTGAKIPTQYLIGAGALLAILLWSAFKKRR